MLVPVPVYNALQKQNQLFPYFLNYQDLWDQADGLVTKGKHTGKLIIDLIL